MSEPQVSGAARSRNESVGELGKGLLVPAALLVLWEAATRSRLVPPNWLPPPSAIVAVLADLARSGALVAHVGATLQRLTLGFFLGAGAGTLLGVVSGRSSRVRSLLDPTMQALRSIPSLAWVPLFLLWLGIQEGSKVALIAVGAFFPVYLNAMSGVLSVDRKWVEVGIIHGYRGWRLARHVLVPAALPAYFTGLRSGLGLGWMFVVAAELMGASQGLGYLMVDGQTSSRPELVIAAIIMFAALGKLSDQALQSLALRAQLWRSV
jgi:sulfonate transport system permease protein